RARANVAHGQMEERALDKVMLEFLRRDADVLVCTSIVESGLDIPNANTLIVDRADRLGLGQLYQIRGRVGRSRERAYAYLFYPSSGALTPDAAARLSTLSDHTELGSGFRIAMRDLDIRGAGNLLGDEQSGHVAAVGFELYCQMIDDATEELASEDGARPAPEPLRIDVAEAGASRVEFRGGRLSVVGVELESEQVDVLRERVEGVIYEWRERVVALRVPDQPEARLGAVVALGSALGAAKRILAEAA